MGEQFLPFGGDALGDPQKDEIRAAWQEYNDLSRARLAAAQGRRDTSELERKLRANEFRRLGAVGIRRDTEERSLIYIPPRSKTEVVFSRTVHRLHRLARRLPINRHP